MDRIYSVGRVRVYLIYQVYSIDDVEEHLVNRVKVYSADRVGVHSVGQVHLVDKIHSVNIGRGYSVDEVYSVDKVYSMDEVHSVEYI